ncbi:MULTISPECIES: type II toxin-antitoxin system VapC family toxin [Sphingomonas]|uniref:type II toxin-antitoxin system VapC family toxin n=1 Tax=Sphingomonas TaxID=13687 RepID=UPI00082BD0E1|nr:type II toxin-antitoxin system VapC family toxin [Sphingomonas sp. CCH10-B3]MBA3879693.1 PIN domain nuclease [Sphingobium sp.]
MTIFVDASAIVAMIAKEPEAGSFAEFLSNDPLRITSPLAIWEAVRGVQGARAVTLTEARGLVVDFVAAAGIHIVAVEPADAQLALDAHARFGKGVDPAGLNFGDCFSYAIARRSGAALLFKGDDFAQTDIKDATLT